MIASSSKFYGKIWAEFCLNTGKRFFLEVLFYLQQKERSSPFEEVACFYVTITGNFERF